MLQSSSFFLLVAVSWFPGGCPSPPSPHTFRSVACFFYFSWAFFKGVSDVFFHHHSSCSSSYSCRALFLILMCVLQVTTWFQPVSAISLVICPVWHGHIFRLNIFFYTTHYCSVRNQRMWKCLIAESESRAGNETWQFSMCGEELFGVRTQFHIQVHFLSSSFL